jgi:DNA-binding MurR/RpiR family transcriptional regulator
MNFLDLDIPLESMTGSQKKIADFISKNPARLAYLNEKEIADDLGISSATVSRFWRTIGFANIKEFKNHLRLKMDTTPANKLEDILSKTDKHGLQKEMFHLATNYLNETMNYLSSEQFQQAVSALDSARTIYLYGPGPCECLVGLLEFRLNRLGYNIKKMPKSGHELFEVLANVTGDDVIMLFGFVNMLREMRVLLDYSGKIGSTTILVTDLLVSEMIEMSDIVFYTARGELWEFHSMVAPLVLVESLIVGVSQQNEQKSLAKLNSLHRLRKDYEGLIPRY